MKKRNLPLSKVYTYLEPGPVVMVSTGSKNTPNVMTLSWLTMMDFEPPILGLVLSNRNFSFKSLVAQKECVINIPSSDLIKAVVGVGNTSGKRINKFKQFHLTPLPAENVKAPLIAECFVNLECKVIDAKLANKYNFFILKVVKAWIDPTKKNHKTLHHQGNGIFVIDGKRIKTPSKMK
jgi:flavin reductase (DIM6/NTAB) family NADH-FMN oxidoreductase RutF